MTKASPLSLTEDAYTVDVGPETLRRMASVDRYNRWLYAEIRPYLGQRVIEVGCGIGNMTPFFLDRELLVGIDLLPESVAQVQRQYGQHPNLVTHQGDILDEHLLARLQAYHLDTVVCFNVLEHIADDQRALDHMRRLLQPGGRMALVVPAMPLLYGTLDEGLGHHRRYTLAGLRQAVHGAGFHIERLYYMNLLGVPGWFVSGRILRQRILPRRGLRTFNVLAALFIPLENALRRIVPLPFGQSLVCIARC